MTHPQDLDPPLDLGHPERRIDASPTDKLDGHLLSPLTVQTQLDLSKLALAERLQEQVRAKFGDRNMGGRSRRLRQRGASRYRGMLDCLHGHHRQPGLVCVAGSLLATRLRLRVGLGLGLVQDRDRDGPRDP